MDEAIVKKLVSVDDLPTLPAVMHRILDVVQDERSSSKDLTVVLETDHSISTRILRMANSPFYGIPSRVDSIQRAVVLIGFDAVKMLALATSVFDAFLSTKQFALNPEEFWMHSLGTAKAAQILSQKHVRCEAPEACFTAGLLHDIGKFVLALALEDSYAKIMRLAEERGLELRDLERRALKTDHSEVGAWLAGKWHFPASIATAIGQVDVSMRYVGPYAAEAGVVDLAEKLSRIAGFGRAGDPAVSLSSPAVADNAADVRRGALKRIVDELSEVRDETKALLDQMGR